MNNRKHQNSIIALATLGVYLGLLLAGATPGVLAQQAALTRQSDVKDLVEVKDGLVKHPGRQRETIFVDQIASLFLDLNAYVREDKFSWKSKFEFSIEDLSFDRDGQPTFIGFGSLDSPEGKYFERYALACAQRLILEKVRVSAGTKYSRWPETVNITFSSDGMSIRYEISIATIDNAAANRLNTTLTENLNATVQYAKSKALLLVAEKTTSEVNDIKVILVTRLARSDLDSLLATDAK